MLLWDYLPAPEVCMPIIGARVTVTTAPTVITNPVYGSSGDPIVVSVFNPGPSTVYLGGAGVTALAGFELRSGGTIDLDLMGGDTLYGITASGTQEVQTLKLRQ